MSIYTNQFYVYIYLREDGTPYYVGKGKDKRAWSNCRSISKPTDPSRIVIHTDNLTEEQAFSLERDLISAYGRKDNGTGTLRNMTDGGDGASGFVMPESAKKKLSIAHTGKTLSDDHKKKLSEAHKGKTLTEDHKRNIAKCRTGAKASDETRKKISMAKAGKNNHFYGKELSDEHKKKLSEALSGKNNPQYGKGKPCIVNGVRYETVKQAAREHNIEYATACLRCRNKSKGWSYV